jgi:hypothetical protein
MQCFKIVLVNNIWEMGRIRIRKVRIRNGDPHLYINLTDTNTGYRYDIPSFSFHALREIDPRLSRPPGDGGECVVREEHRVEVGQVFQLHLLRLEYIFNGEKRPPPFPNKNIGRCYLGTE